DPPTTDDEPHPTPAPVALSGPATDVEVGIGDTCARLASGELWCWGGSEQNQLLRADGVAMGGPGRLELAGHTPGKWKHTAFGDILAFGVTEGGDLLNWGYISGRNTSTQFDPEPRTLPTLAGVIDVATTFTTVAFGGAYGRACAIADGRVYCWGKSFETDISAFCTGVPNEQRVPALAPVQSSAFPQQIAVGQFNTCARLTDGTIECCGDDAKGQLGRGDAGALPEYAFTRASALGGYAVQVVTAERAMCALLRDGRVQCWGSNERGELGLGTVDVEAHPSPVTVSF
ncbi:MAG: hypothetical protein K0S65_1799, partial [Labilithrix sp.]|nr:hypothetical protein [Labilithrix sp.]